MNKNFFKSQDRRGEGNEINQYLVQEKESMN